MTGSPPQPREILWELMSPCNNKAAKLRIRLVPKHGSGSHLCGIAWMALSTRRWIVITLASAFLAWIFMLLTVAMAVLSVERTDSTYTHGLLTSVFTILHFTGYLGFAQNSLLLSTGYCMTQIVIVIFEYTEVFLVINYYLKLPDARSPAFYTAASIGALAGVTDLVLLFCTATLIIRLRNEDQELRLLLPVERLEEVANDVLFLRWYHSLPIGPPVELGISSAARLDKAHCCRGKRTSAAAAPGDASPPEVVSESAQIVRDAPQRSTEKRRRRSRRRRRLHQLPEGIKPWLSGNTVF